MWCEEQLFPSYVLFSGLLCEVHSYQCVPFAFIAKGSGVVSVLVLLAITVLYQFIFSFGMLLFTLETGWCCWLFLQVRTSFNMSGKSFSRVGRNLFHSNLIDSVWILYLIPMYVASFLTSFISVLHTCLMLTGSAKLMLLTWLCSTILTLPKYSASGSQCQAWYVSCDESLVGAGVTYTNFLQFSLVLCSPK